MEYIARFYTDEELNTLALSAHQTARDKGWWPEDDAGKIVFKDGDLEDKLVLIASEVGEAFEEYRQPDVDITKTYSLVDDLGDMVNLGSKKRRVEHIKDTKPEGFPIEMADVYIRVLDLLVATGHMPEQVVVIADMNSPGWKKPGKHLYRILGHVADASTALGRELSLILADVECCCIDLGVDLKAAIALKAAYNSTRPARHGGKRA
jgi:hypothetical protein